MPEPQAALWAGVCLKRHVPPGGLSAGAEGGVLGPQPGLRGGGRHPLLARALGRVCKARFCASLEGRIHT